MTTDLRYDERFFTNPHPAYARLRAEAAAVRLRDPNGLPYWLVTRYHQAREALAHAGLSKDPRHAWKSLHAAGLVSGTSEAAVASMLTADPPDHTRLRSPVAHALSAARMRSLRGRIQEVTDRLLDHLAGPDAHDLIGAFAFPLSVTVLGELLGVPLDKRDDFRAWTTAAHTPTFITNTPMPRQQGARRLRAFITALVARRRGAAVTQPADDAEPDLIGALIADEASALTDAEIIETVSHLLLAGQDATTNLIGNGIAALLDHPDQLRLLRARPEAVTSAVEELLRYDGPTARASPRFATVDIPLGPVTVPAGSIVIVGLSAANRDPGRFAAPDVLDITRSDNPHLAFGNGGHFCVAAALARITGQIALSTLVRRFPHLALACPPDQLRWRPTPVFRGLTALPVTVAHSTGRGMDVVRGERRPAERGGGWLDGGDEELDPR